jgi:TonB family protein
MLLRTLAFCLGLFPLFSGKSAADDLQKTADAMLARARQLSDIRSPNAPAFRLNARLSFIGQDLETVHGTYTETWVSSSQWRRETLVGDLRRVEIGGPTRHWLIDDGKDLPEQAAPISTVLEMFPAKNANFEFESATSPDSATQCFLTKAEGEKHLRHAFCFDKEHQVLAETESPKAVGERFANYSCNYNEFSKFGGYFFPRKMDCLLDGHRQLEVKVVDLSPAPSPDTALFTPPAGALEMGSCPVDPAKPTPVSTPYPMSPAGIEDRHASVLLWLIIDIKGKPQALRISRSAGKDFDNSALAAVRAWRFKPATCNGEPMPLALSVEVKFSNNR